MRTGKRYRHIDIDVQQVARSGRPVCGDVVLQERTAVATTVIVCDGMGSGSAANIAATMIAARLLELLRRDFTLRESFARVVATVHEARTRQVPYAAFSAARVTIKGEATVLTYDAPPPVIFDGNTVFLPEQRFIPLGNEVVGEAHASLAPGNALFLMSDGITQSGAGLTGRSWTADGVREYISRCMAKRFQCCAAAGEIIREAVARSDGNCADDMTAVTLLSRQGETLHVLSGPPASRRDDRCIVNEFIDADGMKAICGSTTAEVAARVLNRKLELTGEIHDFTPPEYLLEGIDLVTEGAVTLSQVYNILEAGPEESEENSGVAKLAELMRAADRIFFWVGASENEGNDARTFRRLGVLPRKTVIPLLCRKLNDSGKLALIRSV